jgi:hypothetical protein
MEWSPGPSKIQQRVENPAKDSSELIGVKDVMFKLNFTPDSI